MNQVSSHVSGQELDFSDIRKIQIEILDAIDAHCRKHEITYSLLFGTLLGAVRHAGYIPWDDDIDIMMPRPEYQRFLATFNKNQGRFRVLSAEIDPNFPLNYAKVDCKNTLLIEQTSLPYKMGINVDVFPLDGVPSEPEAFEKFYKNLKFYRDMLVVKTVKLDFQRRSLFRNLMLASLKVASCVFSYQTLVRTINKKITQHSYEGSNVVAISCIQDNKRKHKASKAIYEELEERKFEGKSYRAIKKYDEYLTMQYGDYMTLPPEDERVTHHNFKAYSQ